MPPLNALPPGLTTTAPLDPSSPSNVSTELSLSARLPVLLAPLVSIAGLLWTVLMMDKLETVPLPRDTCAEPVLTLSSL